MNNHTNFLDVFFVDKGIWLLHIAEGFPFNPLLVTRLNGSEKEDNIFASDTFFYQDCDDLRENNMRFLFESSFIVDKVFQAYFCFFAALYSRKIENHKKRKKIEEMLLPK
jgi:hypothetical protein